MAISMRGEKLTPKHHTRGVLINGTMEAYIARKEIML